MERIQVIQLEVEGAKSQKIQMCGRGGEENENKNLKLWKQSIRGLELEAESTKRTKIKT